MTASASPEIASPSITAPTPEPEQKTSRLERALAAVQSPATPSPASPKSTDAAPTVEKVEPEPDHGVHAKALALAQQKEREAYEAKQQLKKYEAELAEAKAREEQRKKLNPLELLKAEHGLDYEGLTKAIVEKKYAAKSPEQETLTAHQTELQALKAKIDAFEQEKAEQTQAQIQAQNLAFIASEIQAKATDYALTAALPGEHASIILAEYTKRYQATGEEPDLHAILAEYEAVAQKDVDALLSSDAVLQRFLANEANKTRVLTILGVTKQNPQLAQQANQGTRAPNNRTSLPHTRASDPGNRSIPEKVASPKGRLEAALSAIRK